MDVCGRMNEKAIRLDGLCGPIYRLDCDDIQFSFNTNLWTNNFVGLEILQRIGEKGVLPQTKGKQRTC